MNYDNDKPCASCPYRREVPLARWSLEEYERLKEQDAMPFGAMFDCHGGGKLPKEQRAPCIGWLLDQKKRGVPCLTLRMKMLRDEKMVDLFNKISPEGLDLYDSIEEMAETNYPGGEWRSPARTRRQR